MVEAGRIDHAHHAGNAYRALTDTVALSEAVEVAKRLTNDQDTLIVVTADHSHTFTIAGYPSRGNPILGKTAIDGVPTTDALGLTYTTLSYANGPGWTGGLQRKEFNPENETAVEAPYQGTALRPDLASVDTSAPGYMQEATVPMGSETHGGEDVAIYANGPSAYLFRGPQEQNVIYHVMADALGLDKKREHGGRRGQDSGHDQDKKTTGTTAAPAPAEHRVRTGRPASSRRRPSSNREARVSSLPSAFSERLESRHTHETEIRLFFLLFAGSLLLPLAGHAHEPGGESQTPSLTADTAAASVCADDCNVPALDLTEPLPELAASYVTSRAVEADSHSHDHPPAGEAEWRFFREKRPRRPRKPRGAHRRALAARRPDAVLFFQGLP
ncbi:alkaline phosphatase [Azotobacter vinelandii]